MCHERDNLELPKDKFTTKINLICLSNLHWIRSHMNSLSVKCCILILLKAKLTSWQLVR